MKLSIRVTFFLIICAMTIWAQDKPQPDRWRGLVLNESSPEQAIERLGQPNSDKTDKLKAYGIPPKWLTKRVNEKVFRCMKWEKLEAMDSAELAFLDGKLVFIFLDPKEQPAAAAIGNIYGVELQPVVSGFEEAMSPQNYERNQGKVYPKRYPPAFMMLGASKQSFISATVSNSVGSVFKELGGVNDTTGPPGKVVRIALASRTLENRDGADALK